MHCSWIFEEIGRKIFAFYSARGLILILNQKEEKGRKGELVKHNKNGKKVDDVAPVHWMSDVKKKIIGNKKI